MEKGPLKDHVLLCFVLMTHYFSGKEGHCLLNHQQNGSKFWFQTVCSAWGKKGEKVESILQMIPENFFHQAFSTFLLSTGRKRTCSVCEKGQRHSPCTLSLKIYWKRSSRGHKPLSRKLHLQHFFPSVHVVSVASCYSLLLLPQFIWGMWGWEDQLSMKEPYWTLWFCKWEKLGKATETED